MIKATSIKTSSCIAHKPTRQRVI